MFILVYFFLTILFFLFSFFLTMVFLSTYLLVLNMLVFNILFSFFWNIFCLNPANFKNYFFFEQCLFHFLSFKTMLIFLFFPPKQCNFFSRTMFTCYFSPTPLNKFDFFMDRLRAFQDNNLPRHLPCWLSVHSLIQCSFILQQWKCLFKPSALHIRLDSRCGSRFKRNTTTNPRSLRENQTWRCMFGFGW